VREQVRIEWLLAPRRDLVDDLGGGEGRLVIGRMEQEPLLE
jgi:hypothetical protein